MADTLATVLNPVASATGTSPSKTAGVTTKTASDATTIANNFETFLTLLTTQLKNQNPLEPLDTNQFTQQLTQFAQVEQQLKTNDQLASIVTMEKSAQSTLAMSFVGQTVAVDGQTTQLVNGAAKWTFSVPKPAAAQVTITNSAGQTVYSSNYTMQTGQQVFQWDGKSNSGQQLPDGAYKMSITAKDASGQSVAIATEVSGTVDSVDLTKSPPVLTVGGQNFTVDQVKRITRAGA
jgi:flagellar basal-body rod modification protein FlgD